MKINISFDLTPEEFRQAMGLPAVENFQQALFDSIIEKMQNGEAGYDAAELYQTLMKESMNNVSQLQQMFFNAMSADKK